MCAPYSWVWTLSHVRLRINHSEKFNSCLLVWKKQTTNKTHEWHSSYIQITRWWHSGSGNSPAVGSSLQWEWDPVVWSSISIPFPSHYSCRLLLCCKAPARSSRKQFTNGKILGNKDYLKSVFKILQPLEPQQHNWKYFAPKSAATNKSRCCHFSMFPSRERQDSGGSEQ